MSAEITTIYNAASGKTPLPTPGCSAVVFTFDDGLTSLYTEVFPMFQTAGAKFTGYIISNNLDGVGSITTAQAQEMDAAGHDMANHGTASATFTTLTQAQIEAELSGCKAVLDAAGMTRAGMHVAYPTGAYDANTLAAMTATGMLTGRTTTPGYANVREVHDYTTLQKIPAVVNGTSTSLDHLKDVALEAKRQNQIAIYYAHAITGAEITKLSALLAYVQSLGMPTLTISEWYALYDAAY